MKIGSARVSSKEQNLNKQLKVLDYISNIFHKKNAGNYRTTTIKNKIPSSYILNSSNVDITISTKEEGQTKVVMASDNIINYPESTELIKEYENGKNLSVAVFIVINGVAHEVIIKKIKSDAN